MCGGNTGTGGREAKRYVTGICVGSLCKGGGELCVGGLGKGVGIVS